MSDLSRTSCQTGMFKAQKQGEEGELSEDELSTGKRDEVGRNKMLQLFGHQVSKQYSREKGLFKNPVRVHVRARGGVRVGGGWCVGVVWVLHALSDHEQLPPSPPSLSSAFRFLGSELS